MQPAAGGVELKGRVRRVLQIVYSHQRCIMVQMTTAVQGLYGLRDEVDQRGPTCGAPIHTPPRPIRIDCADGGFFPLA